MSLALSSYWETEKFITPLLSFSKSSVSQIREELCSYFKTLSSRELYRIYFLISPNTYVVFNGV